MSCCAEKKVIKTDLAPKALGPYSVAVQAGDFIFTAGQVGIDPATNAIVTGGVEAETRQVLTNIQHVLEAAGSSLGMVVKATVFLQDMNDFAAMNAIYGEFFTENFPARSAVQVAALPKGALVEIETVALCKCTCEGEDCDCGHNK